LRRTPNDRSFLVGLGTSDKNHSGSPRHPVSAFPRNTRYLAEATTVNIAGKRVSMRLLSMPAGDREHGWASGVAAHDLSRKVPKGARFAGRQPSA
jgi:hypothetical protein